MGFAAADGHNAAHGTHMGRTHVCITVCHMEHIAQLVQQRIMAADDHDGVLQLFFRAKQTHLYFAAGVKTFQTLRHFQNAVGLHEGGDHAAAAAQGACHQFIAHITHAHTDKLLVFETRYHRAGQNCLGILGRCSRHLQPVVNQGLQQLLDDDDAGNGITGNAQNGLFALRAQNGGLAGFHGDAVIQNFAQFTDDSRGEIFTTGGRTGIQDHHVAFPRCLGNHGLDLVKFIRHNGVHLCLRTPLTHHSGEDRAVELQNIAGLGIGAGRDDLVTGGDDADDGLTDHFHFQHAAGDHSADGGGRNSHMRRQNHFTGANILTDLADMLPGSGCIVDGDGAVLVLDDVFHHDHRVAVFGDGVAGIQHDKLIGIQIFGGGLRRAEGILRVHCHAVHGAGSIVGRADVGVDRMGSNTAAGIPYGDHFGSGAKTVAFQQLQIVFSCLGKGNVGQIFKTHNLVSCTDCYLNFGTFGQTFAVAVDAEITFRTCQRGDQTRFAADGIGVKYTVFAL